jgi:hypothetical protein
MKEEDRGRANTLQQMINLSSPATRAVLYQLNWADDIWSLSQHKVYEREPVMRRTASGKHYRMAPALAEILMAHPVKPVGTHDTNPPTVLVALEETMIRLESYVEQSQLDPRGIASGIREALGMPTRAVELWRRR